MEYLFFLWHNHALRERSVIFGIGIAGISELLMQLSVA